jgi:hypothetical protein
MAQEPSVAKAAATTPAATAPAAIGGLKINEDWAATAVGLILVVLVLVGIIAKGMVP